MTCFDYYLDFNSSIDHVCVKSEEKESREVRKNPNRIDQKQQLPLPFRKQKCCTNTHTADVLTPKDKHIIHTYTAKLPAHLTDKHTLTHTATTTFISSAAQQVFLCQSINIDSHFDSTYSFIYLLIQSLIHFTSKKCHLLRLESCN